MKRRSFLLLGLSCVWIFGLACSGPGVGGGGWPRHELKAHQVMRLRFPEPVQFDASGLVRTRRGELLVINDKTSGVYRVVEGPGGDSADVVRVEDCFTDAALAAFTDEGRTRLDLEGIAEDEAGRIYLCAEAQRWILVGDRLTNGSPTVRRLPIDWAPVRQAFTPVDANASFEGIAVSPNRIYVANERNAPLIIAVDRGSGRVVDHFAVYPRATSLLGTHYSDLSWWGGHLFVLLRQHRVILEVDPRKHRVVAEFDYGGIEESLGYRKSLPVGLMEGLAVDKDWIWLVTDNGGWPNGKGNDRRPSLLKCRRP